MYCNGVENRDVRGMQIRIGQLNVTFMSLNGVEAMVVQCRSNSIFGRPMLEQ